MNFSTKTKVSGKILFLEVHNKHGELKHRFENIPNILLNSGLTTVASLGTPGTNYTYTSTAESYEDLDGTWNQSGNTITRATGSGTFPTSPSQIGNELYWYDAGSETGHRCHVTARSSDTSITVSGMAKTITGGKLRRFIVNGQGISNTTGFVQSSNPLTTLSDVYDDTAGTHIRLFQVNFNSSASAYTLGSLIINNGARIKLPVTIDIEIDDQITYQYQLTETNIGRSQTYELGPESIGIPQKHSMLTIAGSGGNVDVTFSGATHFLAGDKLDLRSVVPKRFPIASASSTSTTFTINTTGAHGLSVSDSVMHENCSVAGYNGTFTVSAIIDSDTYEITDAANPGAMGASGTTRLTTPGSYFDDLGLATIASMVSSSVARITSGITGPPVDPANIGGDPGVELRVKRRLTGSYWGVTVLGSTSYALTEANAKALADITSFGSVDSSGSSWTLADTPPSSIVGNPASDFTNTVYVRKNSGAGTDATRIKQLLCIASAICSHQITFNTPFNKTTSQRLTIGFTKQLVRDLDLTGL